MRWKDTFWKTWILGVWRRHLHFFHWVSPLQHSGASSQPLQVNNDLILAKSITSCQFTIHVCQKTLKHPPNRVCCRWRITFIRHLRPPRLSRQVDVDCLWGLGRASLLLITAFDFSSTLGTDQNGGYWGRDRENKLGEEKYAVCLARGCSLSGAVSSLETWQFNVCHVSVSLSPENLKWEGSRS